MPPKAQTHDSVKQEFAKYRKRAEAEINAARVKGRDEAILDLLGLVDDCDRALALLAAHAAPDRWFLGVEQLRDTAMQRFAALGYESFFPLGEHFSPEQHEALGVDPSPGADGQITSVHRRGWRREQRIVVPAGVIVRSAAAAEDAASEQDAPPVEQQPAPPAIDIGLRPASRRRHRPSEPVFYACPYESPGCQGDCPQCLADRGQL